MNIYEKVIALQTQKLHLRFFFTFIQCLHVTFLDGRHT